MKFLYIIPARGGSKGVPGKNIKLLASKPLICYSIDIARSLVPDNQICVSTDDDEIINLISDYGLKVPFKRPPSLATDSAGTQDVIIHALEFYKSLGIYFDGIVLLQPTSPFRSSKHVHEAIGFFNLELDMVVSVKETHSNPYFSLFEENNLGFLEKSKKGEFISRQDCPKIWEFNGAIYVINCQSIFKKKIGDFDRIVKYVMSDISSVDIDSQLDWSFCEFILERGIFNYE